MAPTVVVRPTTSGPHAVAPTARRYPSKRARLAEPVTFRFSGVTRVTRRVSANRNPRPALGARTGGAVPAWGPPRGMPTTGSTIGTPPSGAGASEGARGIPWATGPEGFEGDRSRLLIA